MILSIPGVSGITKTHSYRLINRQTNAEDDLDVDSNERKPGRTVAQWSNPGGLRLALILLILSFLFNIIHLYKSHSSKSHPEFIPEIPYTTHPVIFDQDRNWAAASPSVDKNWNQHINNGDLGYIRISNPQAYNLKPGVRSGPNATSEIFSISMYHQLHCLAMIRQAYYHPMDSHVHGHGSRSPLSEAERRTAHLDHCFDYLRQGITCAADMAVEWARVEVDGSRREVDGWGIPHRQCRDMEKVEAFMQKHRLP